MKWLKGWKSYVGAAIVVGSVILKLVGYPEVAEAVLVIGGALGLVGLRHKMGRMVIQHKVNNVMDDIASDPVKVQPEDDPNDPTSSANRH